MHIKRIITSRLPLKIDKDLRDLIRCSYFESAEAIGTEEFNYIASKIVNKISITKCASSSWIRQLSDDYSTLFEIFCDSLADVIPISDKSKRLIAAAIFYFINPFDVIPDYTPGIGYVDDLFVLILCLKSLDKQDTELIHKSFNKYTKTDS